MLKKISHIRSMIPSNSISEVLIKTEIIKKVFAFSIVCSFLFYNVVLCNSIYFCLARQSISSIGCCFFVYIGKIHSLVLASIFAVALVASDDGNLPSDPVFWCLKQASAETFRCYVSYFRSCQQRCQHLRMRTVLLPR